MSQKSLCGHLENAHAHECTSYFLDGKPDSSFDERVLILRARLIPGPRSFILFAAESVRSMAYNVLKGEKKQADCLWMNCSRINPVSHSNQNSVHES